MATLKSDFDGDDPRTKEEFEGLKVVPEYFPPTTGNVYILERDMTDKEFDEYVKQQIENEEIDKTK